MSYRMVYFRISSSGYPSGWSSDQEKNAFREESRRMFKELGWDVHKEKTGGIDKAVEAARKWCRENGKDLRIEVEVRNTDEIRQAIAAGADRIMLDNFTPERTAEAVKIIRAEGPGIEIESSGGITLDTLRAYGEAGVDYISVGALTHSVKGLDMSFKAC